MTNWRWRLFQFLMAPAWAYEALLLRALDITKRVTVIVERD